MFEYVPPKVDVLLDVFDKNSNFTRFFEGGVTKNMYLFSGGTSRNLGRPRTPTTDLLSYRSQNPIMLEACLESHHKTLIWITTKHQ